MTATSTGRMVALDRLRGLAIVLMVTDHWYVAFPEAGTTGALQTFVRLTFTRASLPLFCLVAGALLPSEPRWRRLGGIVLAGLAATVLGAPVGIGQPDILLIFAAVLAVAPWMVADERRTYGWLVLAVLQPVTWPVPWSGYQPGTVLALVLAGHLVGRGHLAGIVRERSLMGGVTAWLGRHPLSIYVGHLAVIGGLSWAS